MSSYRRIVTLIGLLALTWSLKASARAVIGEVLWAGSDLSSADEWVEVTCFQDADDVGEFEEVEEQCDIGGWRLTSLNAKGEEVTIFRFATGATIEAGAFVVIANADAAHSRLLYEPWAVATTMSLPNTKLLLRLRNAIGDMMDAVDDGSGAPFAGANKLNTGTGFVWASMERIALSGSGQMKTNWRTAVTGVGFDSGAPMYGTPGQKSLPVEQISPHLCSRFTTKIDVQSGDIASPKKVTVNVQAVASGATLSSLRCLFDFSDGTRIASCNPPSHTFTERGIHTISLTAADACGAIDKRSIDVEVLDASSEPSMGYLPPSCPPLDAQSARGILINEFLPDPAGDDALGEWIEIKNAGPFSTRLCGIGLQTSSSLSLFPLDDIVLDAGSIRVVTRATSGIALPNKGGSVRIILRSMDGLPHLIEEVTYPSASVEFSWLRSSNGLYAWSSKLTPGAEISSSDATISHLASKQFFAQPPPTLLQESQKKSLNMLINKGSMRLLNTESDHSNDVYGSHAHQHTRMFGIVDDVIDGNTIVASLPDAKLFFPHVGRLKSFRVQMIGIDPTENSIEFLRSMLLRKRVRLELEEKNIDASGRLLAYVFLNGHDVQAYMISAGLTGVADQIFERADEYRDLEDDARVRGLGLWKNVADD